MKIKNNFIGEFAERLRAIESILIPHHHFKSAVERLCKTLEMCRGGAEARHTLLTGEAGAGKTWLARHVESLYPRSRDEYNTIIPVLIVETPPTPTLKGIGEAILYALGDPLSHRGSAFDKFQRALAMLEKVKTELVVFDELQHFLDHGKTNSLISVTDWLKRFIDEAQIPCVLMGLPRCKEILQVNEQLRRRFSSSLELPAFSLENDKMESDFRGVLHAIDKALPTERLSGLAEPEMARRLYFACNGLIGYLHNLISAAYELMVTANRAVLATDLFEQAFTEAIWCDGRHALNPFHRAYGFRALDRIGEPFAKMQVPGRLSIRRSA